jgi:hypothetical protein
MIIKWKGPAQHTDQGLVSPGDVVDTAERGIPDDVAAVWVRDGDAEEMKPKKAAKKNGGEEV